MKDYDDYIVFLLGSDDFAISKRLRDERDFLGMDGFYDLCIEIAKKFQEFDNELMLKYSTIDLYSSLQKFLQDYDKQLFDYIEKGIDFDIDGGAIW